MKSFLILHVSENDVLGSQQRITCNCNTEMLHKICKKKKHGKRKESELIFMKNNFKTTFIFFNVKLSFKNIFT